MAVGVAAGVFVGRGVGVGVSVGMAVGVAAGVFVGSTVASKLTGGSLSTGESLPHAAMKRAAAASAGRRILRIMRGLAPGFGD